LEEQSPSGAGTGPGVSPTVARPSRSGWLRIFQPAPPAAVMLTDPKEISAKYHSWQRRVLVITIFGYAMFYFVRKNLSIAVPAMEHDLGLHKSNLGLLFTLSGLLYGVSKFANGFLADRANARAFLATGLAVSAVLNVFFGFSSSVAALGLIWMFNGWFQGMGFPPCARLLTHWFPPNQLATKMSIWNLGQNIGSALILILSGYLVVYGWRTCFFVPAGIALAGAIVVWLAAPDTPPSVGLPEVAGTHDEKAQRGETEEFKAFVMERVFRNKYIWLVSAANFFVYMVRFAVLDWGPALLTQYKHIRITHAGWMVATFEACGVTGAIIGGWLTDRFLGGRAVRTCLIYMILAGVATFVFWKVPVRSELLTTGLLSAIGFFIYGPQCLLAVAAANLATKRAAATAIGLTSIFGYASTLLSGWGLGTLVDHYGWDAVFPVLLLATTIGALLFLAALPSKAHGYAD